MTHRNPLSPGFAARRILPLAAAAVLAGCATQMDTPSPSFGKALNAAKDAQRINRSDRDDGLRPLSSELPAGVTPPAPGGAYGGGSGPMAPAGVLITPAGSR